MLLLHWLGWEEGISIYRKYEPAVLPINDYSSFSGFYGYSKPGYHLCFCAFPCICLDNTLFLFCFWHVIVFACAFFLLLICFCSSAYILPFFGFDSGLVLVLIYFCFDSGLFWFTFALFLFCFCSDLFCPALELPLICLHPASVFCLLLRFCVYIKSVFKMMDSAEFEIWLRKFKLPLGVF